MRGADPLGSAPLLFRIARLVYRGPGHHGAHEHIVLEEFRRGVDVLTRSLIVMKP